MLIDETMKIIGQQGNKSGFLFENLIIRLLEQYVEEQGKSLEVEIGGVRGIDGLLPDGIDDLPGPTLVEIKYGGRFPIKETLYRLYSICKKENVKAFVVMTETGMTARMISRFRPNLPIIALTNDDKIRDQLCLSYGVIPLMLGNKADIYKQRNVSDIEIILDCVKKSNYIKKGDRIIVVYGEDWGTPGKTCIMRIQEVS